MRKCSQCEYTNNDDGMFCTQCGAPLNGESSSPGPLDHHNKKMNPRINDSWNTTKDNEFFNRVGKRYLILKDEKMAKETINLLKTQRPLKKPTVKEVKSDSTLNFQVTENKEQTLQTSIEPQNINSNGSNKYGYATLSSDDKESTNFVDEHDLDEEEIQRIRDIQSLASSIEDMVDDPLASNLPSTEQVETIPLESQEHPLEKRMVPGIVQTVEPPKAEEAPLTKKELKIQAKADKKATKLAEAERIKQEKEEKKKAKQALKDTKKNKKKSNPAEHTIDEINENAKVVEQQEENSKTEEKASKEDVLSKKPKQTEDEGHWFPIGARITVALLFLVTIALAIYYLYLVGFFK